MKDQTPKTHLRITKIERLPFIFSRFNSMEGGSEKDNPFFQVKGKKGWLNRGQGNRCRSSQRGSQTSGSRGTTTYRGGFKGSTLNEAKASGLVCLVLS